MVRMKLADIIAESVLYAKYEEIENLLDDIMWMESEINSDKLEEFQKFVSKRMDECFISVYAEPISEIEIELEGVDNHENDD